MTTMEPELMELTPHAALVHNQLDAAELQRMTLHRDGRRWED